MTMLMHPLVRTALAVGVVAGAVARAFAATVDGAATTRGAAAAGASWEWL